MNKSYISVWNEALGSWVAASENTAARGKRSASRRVVVAAVAVVVGSAALLQAHEVLAANAPVYDNLNIISGGNGAAASSSGAGSIAIGSSAKAVGQTGGDYSAIAIGVDALANGQAAMAIGEASSAKGNRSMALGNSSEVTGDNSVALGADSKVTATGSVALGVGSVADQANTVSVGSATSQRRIVNMAAGQINATSTDAINGGQLYNTASSTAQALGGGSILNADGSFSAPYYSVGGTMVRSVGDAVTNLDGRTTQNTAGITQNVADIAQNTSVITQNTNDIAQQATSITNVQNQLADGTVGLVQQDAGTRAITVAKDMDGTVVNVAGTAGNRTVTGVAAGAVNASSVDAVNGGQLYRTASSTAQALGGGSILNADGSFSAPYYSVGGTMVRSVGDAVTNLDGRTTQNAAGINQNVADIAQNTSVITQNTKDIAQNASIITQNTKDIAQQATSITNVQNQLADGTVGLVQQDAGTRAITVAKDMDGTVVNVAGTAGNRTVTGVAAGAVNASSVDAVNGGQLYGTASSTAQALGGGATVNADGTLSAPNYSVDGTTVHSVGDAVTNIDGRTTQNTAGIMQNTKDIAQNTSIITQNTKDIAQNASNITNVQNQLADGTVGLVQQDANTRDITVAKDMDGTVVNLAGTAGNRTVTGVAAGVVSASSVDAVNGGQLYGTASSTAQALGGGASVNTDGTISAPSYKVGGTTVHSVGDAVTNLDDRVTQNTTDITKLQTQVGDVGTQLSGAVQYDRHVDGSVNFGSLTLGGGQNAGPVILTNVANGTSQYDAVNYGQLSALQDQVTDLNGQVKDLGSQVSNIQSIAADASSSDSNSAPVANAVTPGTGVGSTVVGAGAAASGDNAMAVGANAAATGANSTAIGSGSQAANANSVALGQGSVTDRDNSVSVGSATQQRQITNVAAGTADTDAVNVGQLNSSVAQGVQQANNYTDQRFNDMNSTIDSIAKKSYSGSAAAIAMANLPQAPAAGKSIVSVAGGTYAGQSAAALGVSTFSRNGKWIIKASASTTTGGTFAVGAGAGYVF
ncbi:YadA-like family protein [Paraburkholderia sp. HD33-4]|uniref:YadA-like family protein n=1 Tax=Paraburkholderia sp. HD33-4 TaxID=2883242 RepID=UPI001F4902BC|nr:YadA-like family protein [Paraburkholderia sp. HD33-4]